MAQKKKKTTDVIKVVADCEAPTASANIENMIYSFRGVQVMIDHDLALLYGVKTKVLNQAVNRNIERFPERFRFQLSQDETNELVTNCDRLRNLKHSSILPRPLPLHRRDRLSYRGLAEGLGQEMVRLWPHGDWG